MEELSVRRRDSRPTRSWGMLWLSYVLTLVAGAGVIVGAWLWGQSPDLGFVEVLRRDWNLWAAVAVCGACAYILYLEAE